MRGPLILFALLGILGCLMWWALVGDDNADLTRGREETELTFGLVEDEIRAMDDSFQHLTRQNFMLSWRRQHEELRSGLAELRERRVGLEMQQDLAQRERLAVFRELVVASDRLLARAKSLHRRTQARYDFMIEVSPLLQQSRHLRDLLIDAEPEDPLLRTRSDSLAGTFANLEQGAKIADNVLIQNLQQGATLAGSEVRNLKRLIESQQKLADEMGLSLESAKVSPGS